ncbi:MAG: pentapeptide repeat-containing protein [Proteobacteria bacterium]|nr:MAG: pentapeptide repeat-containing protein [Pseudomonadota bacterium]
MSLKYIESQTFTGQMAADSLLYTDFETCVFNDCDFTDCDFTGTVFIDCAFNDCNFAATPINYVALRGATFTRCDFTDVNFAMVDQLLFDISFTHCTLDYAKFYKLKLARTVFSNCSIIAADFMAADMTDVTFDNCNLHQTVFHDTLLQKADFTSSFNYAMDPEKNKLKRAIFSKDGLAGLLAKYEIVVK